MSQQQGSNVKILIDTETVFKSNPSPDAMYLPFVSESIRLNRNLISSNTIRSSRDPQQPVRGNVEISGDITIELAPQHGRLLKHIYGGYAAAITGEMYTHTYKIGSLPVGMVIEKQFTDIDSARYFQYNGCRVNSFRMSAKSEGMIECTVNIMGAKETISVNSMDATPTDLGFTPFEAFEATITKDNVALGGVTEFEFTLENNLDGDNYIIDGTGERDSMPAGAAKVTGTVRAIFDSITLYNIAINNTECSLAIAFTKGTGAGSSGNEKLTITFDEVIFKPQAPIVDGPTGVMVELPFEAFYRDGTESTAARAVLLSSTAAY